MPEQSDMGRNNISRGPVHVAYLLGIRAGGKELDAVFFKVAADDDGQLAAVVLYGVYHDNRSIMERASKVKLFIL